MIPLDALVCIVLAYLVCGGVVALVVWPVRAGDTLYDEAIRGVICLLWWQVLPAAIVMAVCSAIRAASRRRATRRPA